MRAIRIGLTKRTWVFFILAIAGSAGALPGPLIASHARAQDARATLEKANLYIEVAKMTERAVDSWDRYASWVNMKTGPTGKERYISYGMYELYDIAGLSGSMRGPCQCGTLNSGPRCGDGALHGPAYEDLAPVMNEASPITISAVTEADKAAEGQALHKQMVPLATRFLAERKAMMPLLRIFVRDAEQQEVADLEKREGRKASWHVGNVMHTLNRVMDTFPRDRPQPMDAETLDCQTNGNRTRYARREVRRDHGGRGAAREHQHRRQAIQRSARPLCGGCRGFGCVQRRQAGGRRCLQAPAATDAAICCVRSKSR